MRIALCEMVQGMEASTRFPSPAADRFAGLTGIRRDLQWVEYALGFLREQVTEGEQGPSQRDRAVYELTNQGLTWLIISRYFRCFKLDRRARLGLAPRDVLAGIDPKLREFHEGLEILRDTAFVHAGKESPHHGLLIVVRDEKDQLFGVPSFELEEPSAVLEVEQVDLLLRLVKFVADRVDESLVVAKQAFQTDIGRVTQGHLEALAKAGRFSVPQQAAFALVGRWKPHDVEVE